MLVLACFTAAPTPAPADDPLERFHGQRIRWGDCPEKRVPAGMRCGTVRVPLDYAAPAKGAVEIALARIPASDPDKRLGSLLLNYGGPGGPGIAGLAADPKAFADLGERYDLVAFDPRGVGHSEPVSCGGSQQVSDEAQADAAAQLAALRAVVRRCELASGPVLPHIGTVNVSRDMDVLRQVLGDRKLNYFGFSYGTRLGAVYAAQFPGNTGRMVLDGVDTLVEPLAEQALVTARGQQRALDRFLSWCAGREGCVYGSNTRSAKEKVNALVARLDKEPLVGQDGSYVTGQDAVRSIAAALYSRQTWPQLADALATAEHDRDPVGLLQLGGPTDPSEPHDAEEQRADGPGAVPGDNAEAALTAVTCADDPDRSNDKASPASIARELAELKDEFLKASTVFGPRQLMTVLACYGRPAGTDFIRKIDRPGAPRILLVGTRGDPATPYEWTEETAKRLGSAVVVDYKGDGHTGYAVSSCVREYAHRFLLDGRLPTGTRSCPAVESE
ncbi:alpha/beta hydrolase [Streptomyces sp. NBC_00190]|uniref:alpha/beta hydrolase n=1 Tax=unclassified Streptomyces TaxID=2593676 RepID=UPI002E2B896A|nr:alpha/beta hydrolase [Streptomyces sp. NBC_00190]WSZ41775.1 alpha/beta hydrolase [Streptomyces sp. NBC_00868]